MNTSGQTNRSRVSLTRMVTLFATLALLILTLSVNAPANPAAAGGTVTFDSFDSLNAPPWGWIGVEPVWSIEEIEEDNFFLRIPAATGSPGRHILGRPIADGDFTITTRLQFEPTDNYQFAGLIIYQDDENFLQFGRAYCSEEWCVGNGLYFDYSPQWDAGNFATPVDSPNEAYLRLERRGEMVRALFSHDGQSSWREIGIHSIPPEFQVNGVGITAGQDFFTPDHDIHAYFDFFELSEGGGFLPDGYHDYDQGDVPAWACNAGGWVVDPDDPETDVNVEIVVDHTTVANLTAGEFRQDLLDAKVCVDGNCSFHRPLWGVISTYEPHTVAVWAQDTETGDWVLLRNSNKPLTCRTYDIYVFYPETGITRNITNLPGSIELLPKWSPDGKKLSFTIIESDSLEIGIYTVDLKTGMVEPLIGAEGGYDAVWSPNGKYIAFDRAPFGDASIYMVPSAGGERKLIRSDARMATWAPNSQRIAFAQPSDYSIHTIDLKTGSETMVAMDGELPAWSPDGEWIAFRRGDSIWKVQVNNQGLPLADPVQVTHMIPDTSRPAWSNNSKTIAFQSGQTQDYDLWTIPAAGGTPSWLTGAPNFGDYDPAYSANGKMIAYISFSPDGQAARQWVSPFLADLEPGFWSEGSHTYRYEWEYTIPDPGQIISDFDREVLVSGGAPLYDGIVLLRGEQLRGIRTPDEMRCEGVPAVNPDQRTRLLNGWLTDAPMLYEEAVAHINSISARALLDENSDRSSVVELSHLEIFPWSSLDWGQFVCTFTEAPLKMDLRVNYGHDWVETVYEAGHQVDITVTESDGVTVKATASVFTEPMDWWGGQPGFKTTPEDWSPSPPDLQPLDWVFARVDNGAGAQVQLGEISGVVDFSTDSISGTIYDPNLTDSTVWVECLDWGSGQSPPFDNVNFGDLIADGINAYTCDMSSVGWDVQPWQEIGVGYFTPEGHWVANAFRDERWMAMWTFDPEAGFLSEGMHNYWFLWEYTVPDTDSAWTSPISIEVSSEALLYEGKALLWTHSSKAWTGAGCEDVSALQPDQPMRFVLGWVNDFSMTFDEAWAHFNSFTVSANWDDTPGVVMSMGELLPFTGTEDRLQYLCGYTEHP